AEGFPPSADKFRRWLFGSGLGHLQPLALAAEGRGPPPVIPVAILLRASVRPACPTSHWRAQAPRAIVETIAWRLGRDVGASNAWYPRIEHYLRRKMTRFQDSFLALCALANEFFHALQKRAK